MTLVSLYDLSALVVLQGKRILFLLLLQGL